MAYGFGSTVNPQLGATNYSGFLQGALSGAQMQAQGGAAIGQGIASAGQGIGAGIQKYQQNKMITSTQIGKFEAAAKSDPGIIQQAPDYVKKLIKKLENNGNLGLNDAARLGAYVDVYSQQEPQRIAKQAAELQGYMGQGGGSVPSFINMRSYDPRARSMAEENVLRNDLLRAQASNYREQALAKTLPGTVMSIDQINVLKGQGFDVKAIPLPNGEFRVESMSPFAPAAQTNINSAKTPEAEFYSGLNEGLAKEINDFQSKVIPSAQGSIDNINRARAAFDEGAKAGPGQTLKLAAAGALNAIIPDLIDTSKQERLSMSLADMSLEAAQKIAGQGQVTDSERKRIDKTIPTLGNTENAIRYALSYAEAVNKRNLAKNALVNELIGKRATPNEVRAAWNSFNEKNPLVFSNGSVSFGTESLNQTRVGRFTVEVNP